MGRYTLGLDLGQAQDYSALAIVEQSIDRERDDVVDLRRWRLGTPYPEIVADVAALRLQPPLLENCALVVDATGVGRPVVDLFQVAGCQPIGVMITAGTQAHYDDETGYWMVPKKELVSSVQVGLQQGTLRIARSLPEMQTLAQELTQFQAKITAAANVVTGAWREGQHDDLVLALALAVWYASQYVEVTIHTPPHVANRWAEMGSVAGARRGGNRWNDM
jgi:hypothetical protein